MPEGTSIFLSPSLRREVLDPEDLQSVGTPEMRRLPRWQFHGINNVYPFVNSVVPSGEECMDT